MEISRRDFSHDLEGIVSLREPKLY